MVYFLKYFLYFYIAKQLLVFENYFLFISVYTTCFLFTLQTQLTRRSTSIPKNLKKHRHMTFMMTSVNDNKNDNCHFFDKDLFPITNTVYAQNVLRYCMFFHRRSTNPDQGMVNQGYSFFSRVEKNKYHSMLCF